MVTTIRKGARLHLYLAEWRESRGLSVEQLADRLDVDRSTVYRWEKNLRKPTDQIQARVAHALDIEPADLWRRPDNRPSIDAMMRDAPDDLFDAVAEMARRLTRRAS